MNEFDQFIVRYIGGGRDAVSIIEQHAHVTDAPNAGMCTGGCLSGFHAREAQDALFGFTRVPVVVNFLVRAGGHAHAPGTAIVLIDQHDAVFGALVNGARWAGRHAGRIETVVADARHIVENHAIHLVQRGSALHPAGSCGWGRSGHRACEPPRSSSQLGPDSMCSGLPVTIDIGMAVGWSSPSGAVNRSA